MMSVAAGVEAMGGEVVVVAFTGMCTSVGASGRGSTAALAGRATTCREEEGKEGPEGSSDLLTWSERTPVGGDQAGGDGSSALRHGRGTASPVLRFQGLCEVITLICR
jgi:hypothetical protein